MKPNILLIFADQWRHDFLGYQNPKVKTPFLDELAGQGETFNCAYAAAPSCIPARACLATGQSPYSCGRIGYKDGIPWDYEDTMMSTLSKGGYQTINVGKTHFYPRKNSLGFEINKLYDPQNWMDNELSDYHKWLKEETNGKVQETANIHNNNSYVYLPWCYDNYLHPTEWIADTAIDQLENRDDNRPFFMQLGFHRPHPPLDPPEQYYNMYRDTVFDEAIKGDWEDERTKGITSNVSPNSGKINEENRQIAIRAYAATITHTDHQIGKILYYLNRHNMGNNTVVIFSSDHGDMLGDHNMFRKVVPFEGSAHIPFIIKTPNNAKNTGDYPSEYEYNNKCITHMDVMPTLLNIANIEIPKKVEGIDIFKDLKRDYIHGEHSFGDYACFHFITNGEYKYCLNTLSNKEYFFILKDDPKEVINCIEKEEYFDIIEKYRNEVKIRIDNREEGNKDTITKELVKDMDLSRVLKQAKEAVRKVQNEST